MLDFGVLNIPSRANNGTGTGTGTGNSLTSYLVCKTMSDENAFKHNEQTSSSEEVRTKTASFMHQSSILVA